VTPVKPIIAANSTRDVDSTPTPIGAESETKPDEPLVLPALPGDGTRVIIDVNSELRDAFFEYDRAELRSDGLSTLKQDADLLLPVLRDFPDVTVIIEGHCDERGSAAYNLGLGDHRGARAAEILASFGVPEKRIQRISYGKERPQCTDPMESCWQRNRRVHLSLR